MVVQGKQTTMANQEKNGVVHPAKPGKVCLVFECSADYRGTLLKNQLISGPDLTNQLVDVLRRFREEQVAFIADAEAMFHQVRVPKDQRSLLRFCGGRMEISEIQLKIMKCAYIYLVVFYLQVAAIML